MSKNIERILRFQSGNFKHENIVRFFSNNPRGYVNSIIQNGDDIGYITSTCQIDLVFNGNVKYLEVMITKGTSAVKA